MKKKIPVLILLIAITMPIWALQTIRGKIIDSKDQAPLDFVNVSLIPEKKDKPAAGVISDGQGKFELPNVPKGKYTLKVSFVGYNTLEIPLFVNEEALEMGMIKLSENSQALNEVEVVGQGSQMRFDIDKKVFTVDQNIAASGGSATEVLQNIPSVDVDNEGNIALRNSSNVEVWINGKPSGLTSENRAQILQQMPAESIENIEIMTNPSAKFSPEGTSGIINLVLKKNRKAGYFGSVSLGTTQASGAKPGTTAGFNFNYSSNKLDAYLNVGYRAMNFQGGGFNDRYSLAGTDTLSLLHSNQLMKRSFSGLFTRAGLDYHMSENHTLSASLMAMDGSRTGGSQINYLLTDIQTNNILRNYMRSTESPGYRKHLDIDLTYKWDMDKLGSNLIATVGFARHGFGGSNEYYQYDSLSQETSRIRQKGQGYSPEIEYKIDYTKKFSENQKLEAGLQGSTDSRYSPGSAVNSLTNAELFSYYNDFKYHEQIHAAYLTYGSKIDRFTLQAGLRTEYFWRQSDNSYKDVSGVIQTDVYPEQAEWQFFPSLFLGYDLLNHNEIQLNVTRRVNRPRGRQINPFRDYSDSANISYGNLGLNPEYTTAFELNYLKTWDNHSLSASLYHRATEDVIQDVRYLHAGTMETTFMNVTNSTNSGLEFVAKNRLFRIMNLTSSLNFYYGSMDSARYTNPYNSSISTLIPAQNTLTWSGRVMANMLLGKNTSAQITADYSSPRLIAQGRETASYAIDLGLRQNFLQKQLSLNLMVRDVLNSRSRRTVTWGDGFYQVSDFSFHGRMIGLTASWNFGNMKPKKNERQQERGESGGDMNFDE